MFRSRGSRYLYGSRYVVLVALSLNHSQKALHSGKPYWLLNLHFHSGMYALRERRQHVTQEDFEFAIAKVSSAGVTS